MIHIRSEVVMKQWDFGMCALGIICQPRYSYQLRLK